MNKRIEKMIKNYEAGNMRVRRDQLKKAVEEGAFDYIIERDYDEIYNMEPVKMEATIDNISGYWFRNANIYCRGVENNILKVTMCYGYGYKDLYVNLEDKKKEIKEEIAATEDINIEGIEVVYNEKKKGIEILFENKELATQEVRTALKAVGFRYFPKFKKWIARQNDKTIATVNKLFTSPSEVKEMKETKKVEENTLNKIDKIDLFKLTTYTEVEREKNYNTKEIAKEIRTALKSRFKFVKFSVTSKDRISVTIKSAPFEKDSIYLKAIQEYTDKLVESYKFCISYDPYGDYGSSYNFYFFGCKVGYDFVQTEATSEIIEAIKQFDIKTAEAEELKRIEEEKQHKEYLIKMEQEKAEAEERQRQVKVDKEYINNNVEVVDLEEEKQYYVKNAYFAKLNKNNTLQEYKEKVSKGDYYFNTLKVTREVYFKDEKSYNLYINMLLEDFDFINGTGGSYTDDLRINSIADYYNMSSEERETVKWLLKGIAVYLNNKLMFVIDAQGYSYARYVGLIGGITLNIKNKLLSRN